MLKSIHTKCVKFCWTLTREFEFLTMKVNHHGDSKMDITTVTSPSHHFYSTCSEHECSPHEERSGRQSLASELTTYIWMKWGAIFGAKHQASKLQRTFEIMWLTRWLIGSSTTITSGHYIIKHLDFHCQSKVAEMHKLTGFKSGCFDENLLPFLCFS